MPISQMNYVVTGGASGIGLETVSRLIESGHRVTVLDVRRPELDGVRFLQTDLSDPASIDRSVSEIENGTIDGLANVAGVSGTGGALLTLKINFLGLRHLTQAMDAKFAASASVVNVASFAGVGFLQRLTQHLALAATDDFTAGLQWLSEHPVADDFGYPYSKEVLRVWGRLQAKQWIGIGRRLNTIDPGPVETAILTQFVQILGQQKVDDDIARAGRPGTAADIAPAIVWLLSSESAWVTGADLPVDGGLDVSFFGETV